MANDMVDFGIWRSVDYIRSQVSHGNDPDVSKLLPDPGIAPSDKRVAHSATNDLVYYTYRVPSQFQY